MKKIINTILFIFMYRKQRVQIPIVKPKIIKNQKQKYFRRTRI
jgi:hypothetical protein